MSGAGGRGMEDKQKTMFQGKPATSNSKTHKEEDNYYVKHGPQNLQVIWILSQ